MTEDELVGWHHTLNGHGLSKLQEVVDRETWHAAVHGVTKSQTMIEGLTLSLHHFKNFLASHS